METLFGRNIPVRSEKYEFDYRNRTKLLDICQFFHCRDYYKGSQILVFQPNHSLQKSGFRLGP